MDERVMKYGKKCENISKWNHDICNDEGLCLRSYPYGDPAKTHSEEAKCRTPPASHIDGPFEYGKACKSSVAGLCSYGCSENEVCSNSWLAKDPLQKKSASATCRCKPQ
jgi:hypothetical protein